MQEYVRYIIFAILGGLISWIGQKIVNRKRFLRYTVNTARLGFSTQDELFGNIQVIWNGKLLSNVHFSRVEIQNTSGRDLEDFTFSVYSGEDTNMLVDAKYILGSAKIFDWSEAFAKTIALNQGQEPNSEQIHAWRHHREYTVPVFNRGEVLQVQVLSTGGENGELFVDTRTKGLKMKYQGQVPEMHGIPVTITLPLGILLAALLTCLLVLAEWNVWLTATIAMVLGLFAQSIAAVFYKIMRWPLKIIE